MLVNGRSFQRGRGVYVISCNDRAGKAVKLWGEKGNIGDGSVRGRIALPCRVKC